MLMARGGLASLLKEGSKHLSGLEEAVIRNTEACTEMAEVTRTSLGPHGMSKMVINKHDKLFITSDAATIIKELEVIHPAAKMLVFASEQQEVESGDATNFVLAFGGTLLKNAEKLIRTGLHPSEIIAGYTKAGEKALEEIEKLNTFKVEDTRDIDQVSYFLRSVVGSKLYGYENFLSEKIAEACIQILSKKNPRSFNVENVRVTKILGGGIQDTKVVKGLVLTRDSEGTIKHVTSGKIAVFGIGIDSGKTETKGNVILKTAEDLLGYSKAEEESMEEVIKAISEVGTKVIVCNGSVGELALHFIEKYKMMVVKAPSKFDCRRVCEATGATPLARLGAPTPEELGFCDVVSVEEIGSTKVCIFRQDGQGSSRVSTIIVRAATNNRLDDIERAIDDGVNVFKSLTKDNRFVAGAGGSEIELARILSEKSEVPGLEQYAIKAFSESFEVIPRTLAENSGFDAQEMVTNLYAAHQNGEKDMGIDVDDGTVKNAKELGVLDHLATKQSAIKLATDAVLTILRVDQIIMAKEAGGPNLPAQGARD